jgi:hypothetical protein
MISGLTGVDVDRYYLSEWPIILTNIFWYMMVPGTLAAVWESVRHWGSWQERQMIDPDPFSLPQDDKRGKTEFWMPLVFYSLGFMVGSYRHGRSCPRINLFQNFFMSVPRNWTPLSWQRDPAQKAEHAEKNATDGRFKAAACFIFLAWCTIVFCLWHSIHHYKPRNRGVINSFIGAIRYTPLNFWLTIPLSLIIVAYQFAISFNFDISPLNETGNIISIYTWGYAPIALIVLIHIITGYILPNEDRELIRQRRVRGAEIDAQMGFVKKPNWWRRLNGDHNMSVHDAIIKNVREVGGGQATQRHIEEQVEGQIELKDLPKRNSHRVVTGDTPALRALARREERRQQELHDEQMRKVAGALFGARERPVTKPTTDPNYLMSDELLDGNARRPGLLRGEGSSVTGTSGRSTRPVSTVSVDSLGQQPQQVRSMLDI